jgi:methionyl-tRNA formyltransferase
MENINKHNKPNSWLALYSQTGSEIVNLSKQLGFSPDRVITDNLDHSKWDPEISSYCKSIIVNSIKGCYKNVKLEFYRTLLKDYDVITLHGWLNIIPPEICEEFKLYNGHPGLINYYPELKGKDPQVRAFNNIGSYLYVGSVIHEVTKDIDCGDIICYNKISNVKCGETLDETFNCLKQTSLNSWVDFFTNKRYNIVC